MENEKIVERLKEWGGFYLKLEEILDPTGGAAADALRRDGNSCYSAARDVKNGPPQFLERVMKEFKFELSHRPPKIIMRKPY